MSTAPLLETFAESFAQAAERTSPRAATFVIAGRRIGFRIVGTGLEYALLGALAHHPRALAPAELTICAWSDWPTPKTGLTQPARRFAADGTWRLGGERSPQYITFAHGDQAFLYAKDDLPVDRYATPLRSTLLWWFARHGLHGLHTAAVASAGRGLLLAGHGGAGKSTTALRCLEDGLELLGDDIALVDRNGEVVHSLYSSAKINGQVHGRAAITEPDDRRRTVYWLMPAHADRLPASAPIRALAILAQTDDAASSISALAPGEALRALAPNSLRILATAAGTQAGMFAACAEVVRRVPCHRLLLGRDPRGVTHAVRRLLAT